MSEYLLRAVDIVKTFAGVKALQGVCLDIKPGEIHCLAGENGCGKSTLIKVISGVYQPNSGYIEFNGQRYTSITPRESIAMGIQVIYQDFSIFPNLTVKENILICKHIAENPLDLDDLLETLGLTEHQNKFPAQLSGGQQQRCAIARALIKNPKLLLCDEPTGALDSSTSRDILVLLEEINRKYNTTMLIVTHNNSIKNMVHKVIRLKDGMIREEYENAVRVPAAELEDL